MDVVQGLLFCCFSGFVRKLAKVGCKGECCQISSRGAANKCIRYLWLKLSEQGPGAFIEALGKLRTGRGGLATAFQRKNNFNSKPSNQNPNKTDPKLTPNRPQISLKCIPNRSQIGISFEIAIGTPAEADLNSKKLPQAPPKPPQGGPKTYHNR